MYEPHLPAILRALEIEIIVNHDIDRIDQLNLKRSTLLKVNKLIRVTQQN